MNPHTLHQSPSLKNLQDFPKPNLLEKEGNGISNPEGGMLDYHSIARERDELLNICEDLYQKINMMKEENERIVREDPKNCLFSPT